MIRNWYKALKTKQGEQLLKWGGHSASLDKIKYNAEGNADSLKSGHKVMQQANIINVITNKYEPQQKHRLGTVSKNYWGA